MFKVYVSDQLSFVGHNGFHEFHGYLTFTPLFL